MPRSELIIPITVALIAAIGSAIPVFINNSNIREKPQVYVSTNTILLAPTNTYQTVLKIGNSGSASATNVSLALGSTITITNVSRLLGVTEVFIKQGHAQLKLNGSSANTDTYTEINSHVLELYIPKLIPGTGSVIQLILNFNSTESLPYFKVLVVYDQGSTSTIGGIEPADFADLLDAYSGFYGSLYLAMSIALIIFWVHRRKKLNFKKLFQR